MNRNMLYFIAGAICVAGATFGYHVYQVRRQAPDIQITVGKTGIAVEKQ